MKNVPPSSLNLHDQGLFRIFDSSPEKWTTETNNEINIAITKPKSGLFRVNNQIKHRSNRFHLTCF